MTDLILQIVGLGAAAVVFWRAEPVLNLMAPQCRFFVRLAFWLLTVGAAALIVCIVAQNYTPPPAYIATTVGIAFLLVSERRLRALLRSPARRPFGFERRLDP